MKPRLFLMVFGVLSCVLSGCGTDQAASSALPTAAIELVPTRGVTPIGVRLLLPTATLPLPTARPTALPTETPLPARTDEAGAIADVPAAEQALAVAINDVRSQNGLPPYAYSEELGAAARAHSCDIATHNLISHTSTDGRTLADRLAGANPPWQWPSESIAAGTPDVSQVVAMWMDEPPEGWHRRNILDSEQRSVGVGYCFTAEDASGNHHYWTADFSRR